MGEGVDGRRSSGKSVLVVTLGWGGSSDGARVVNIWTRLLRELYKVRGTPVFSPSEGQVWWFIACGPGT